MNEPETEQLIEQASAGDRSAVQRLLVRHRDRLTKMVAVHLDPRIGARVDPSDVVQETLATAAEKLPAYLANRPVAFYPWLRQIAWERLSKIHRSHLHARRRSVLQERRRPSVAEASTAQLADQLIAAQSSPSELAIRDELRQRMRRALQELSGVDRQLLIMRHVEDLRVTEIADVLQITEPAVRSRLRRALERLYRALSPTAEE